MSAPGDGDTGKRGFSPHTRGLYVADANVPAVFTLRMILAEFRRRRGRAILTALGLGLGIALVIVVGALSQGLSDAQDDVLEPLAGVGTDIAVTRPLRLDDDNPLVLGPNGNITDEERALLETESGGEGRRIEFSELGNPGDPFSIDRFTTFELSFPAADAETIAELAGVTEVARQLTLDLIRVAGEVPEEGFGGPGSGRGPGAGAGAGFEFTTARVSGIEVDNPDLAEVTPESIVEGAYWSDATAREAVLSESYATREGVGVGDTVTLDDTSYTVIGLTTAVGGQVSDVYLPLAQLQAASDREGRVNRLTARADEAGSVEAVAAAIETGLVGTRATTASDLADRVEGSLVDARNLARTLGAALAVVAIVAAAALALLLTLSSVAKRTRELGTLRAVGWSTRRVVGQIVGESVALGALGGLAGVTLGVVGARIASTLMPDLEASVAPAGEVVTPFRPGADQIAESTAQAVSVGTPISIALIVLAVVLAIVVGAIAGAVAGLRASRLRPSEALRTVE